MIMDIKAFTYFGLCLLLSITTINVSNGQTLEGSGTVLDLSGSGAPDDDTLGGDDTDTTVVISSGDGGVVSRTTTTRPVTVPVETIPTKNPDDEGGDDIDEITLIGSGVVISSSGDTSGVDAILPPNTECSDSYIYCWCKSEEGLEIPGTRRFTGDESFASFNCEALISLSESTPAPRVVVTASETQPIIFVHEKTTTRRRPQPPTSLPPYVVEASTKFGKPADVDEPLDGVDHNGVFRDDDVEREPVDPMRPLFSHPGILAAVIGGGVVALLCALLLIMFVVYRMRKKDEGSYPLGPEDKPPRLHTYTRAPNKEFYA